MGAWGVRTFDNDSANDWACELEGVEDLRLVDSTFRELEELGDEYIDRDVACVALAACEVIARLRKNFGYRDASTEKVDEWVAAHPIPVPPELIVRAQGVIARILGEDSELRELWDDAGANAWEAAVADLRSRLTA
jgi:hypothetical protein